MKTKHSPTNQVVTVKTVEVLHEHVVRLGFSDGCVGDVDLGSELWGPVFEPIAGDYDLFRRVRVDLGTIVWPNGADLAPEVLHTQAVPTCSHQSR